jgi:hypothetical protein
MGFWLGHLKERDHLENPSVDWRIILRSIFTKWEWGKEGMGWNDLVQGRGRWWALVNKVMRFGVP